MDNLDNKGFVFLDENNSPFRCVMWGGRPWLMYWNDNQKRWVSLRQVTFLEVLEFPYNLTQEQQDLYFQ